MPTKESFVPIVKQFFEQDPTKAAGLLESLPEQETAYVLSSLPTSVASQVFCRLQGSYAAKVLPNMRMDRFQDIIQKMDSQQGFTMFLSLPPEARQPFIKSLPEKMRKDIQELLTYPEGSAGRLMKTDFVAFRSEMKVKEAINKIRRLAKQQAPAFYVYVIDAENHLIGIINMRDLMLAPMNAPLEEVMRREVFTIGPFAEQEGVAQELAARKFFAAPVMDSERHLLGIIKTEELIKGVQEEATEDLQKMFGAGGDERSFSPILFSLKKRLPWLHFNLATAFLAAGVVAMFEHLIARITVLAVFLPVVAGQGGNAGAQSLAVVMRGLVMKEISPDKAKLLILKETFIGTMNGLVIGVVTALVAWIWHGNPFLGVVIGLGMMVNLTAAGFAGAAIPLAMKAIRMDPAQCSSIILTTITDVVGFFAFLGFALLFESRLIQ